MIETLIQPMVWVKGVFQPCCWLAYDFQMFKGTGFSPWIYPWQLAWHLIINKQIFHVRIGQIVAKWLKICVSSCIVYYNFASVRRCKELTPSVVMCLTPASHSNFSLHKQQVGGSVEAKWGRFSDTAFIRCINTGCGYKRDRKCVCYNYENK